MKLESDGENSDSEMSEMKKSVASLRKKNECGSLGKSGLRTTCSMQMKLIAEHWKNLNVDGLAGVDLLAVLMALESIAQSVAFLLPQDFVFPALLDS